MKRRDFLKLGVITGSTVLIPKDAIAKKYAKELYGKSELVKVLPDIKNINSDTESYLDTFASTVRELQKSKEKPNLDICPSMPYNGETIMSDRITATEIRRREAIFNARITAMRDKMVKPAIDRLQKLIDKYKRN